MHEPAAREPDQHRRMPPGPIAIVDVATAQRRAALHPIKQRIAIAPGHVLDALDRRAVALGKRDQRGTRPPGEMMRWRIHRIVGEARERGGHMRDADDQEPAGFGGCDHVGEHLGRRAQMLEHLERTDRVISSGVLEEMRTQRLIAYVRNAALTREMRVKPGVARLRNNAAKLRKATADIEHTSAGRNVPCRQMKLLPDAVTCPEPALDRISVKLRIEGMVAFEHGIKKVQAGRRFPQAEALHRAEARARVDPHAIAPQIDQEARLDPLDEPHGGLAGHRAERIWHGTCGTAAHLLPWTPGNGWHSGCRWST